MCADSYTTSQGFTPEVQRLAVAYKIDLAQLRRSAFGGSVLGKRTGNSVEFEDRKEYQQGDDLRRVDWRSYARTGRMTVKLFREEIAPRVEIFIDASASMNTSETKAIRTLETAAFFYLAARRSHFPVRVFQLGKSMSPLAPMEGASRWFPDPTLSPLPALQQSQHQMRGGLAIVISDLLFDDEPRAIMRHLKWADRIFLVQVLSGLERNPAAAMEVDALLRLEDAEDASAIDVRLDSATVSAYMTRINALVDEYRHLTHAGGHAHTMVDDAQSLQDCVVEFLRAGMISQ